MHTQLTSTSNSFSQRNFWIVSLSLISGLILSILSWLELCVEHCSANQEYRLFGMPFALAGMAFFPAMLTIHFFSKQFPSLSKLTSWSLAAAFGAEIMFILIQKYEIGHWCPVCLGIALTVTIACIARALPYFKTFYSAIQQGEFMTKIKQGLLSLSFIILGFLMAFVGISKVDAAEDAIADMKNRLMFGSKTSPVEVYFVTDWFCPSCKKIETQIEKILPDIQNQAALFFVDYPIHNKSMNYTPYNLAFLVNAKSNYLKAREVLSQLTEKTETPHDNDVVKAVKAYHIPFKELSFLDVKAGMEFFDKVVKKYDLSATPTIIVTNTKTNQVIKFEGTDEISDQNVLNAIQTLSQSHEETSK
ncbi:thioredoxin domain-containing protein [Candidatus Protochlamydia amoebophila]|uniref:Uncharacterized protein n=1 Tax=Candidatus Protochlamydia amoebophila TaxID=362787 RepID=A0A0C1JNT4_9BACT|nr:thioredoxin domain-containing protein [Candidatus Protochlamydia amoebophila]KIC72201.1 hypothetical protein DB44_CN00070 [Candidatus Protochlamydia amoebophila]